MGPCPQSSHRTPTSAKAIVLLHFDHSLFIRLRFGMTFFRSPSRKTFVVECKGCKRDVPAGVSEMPSWYIAVRCPLCQDVRRYLPTQVGLGNPHHFVVQQARCQVMGEMKRGEACEEQRRVRDRFASTLVIAAAIIAAVRLAREPDVSRPSPRVSFFSIRMRTGTPGSRIPSYLRPSAPPCGVGDKEVHS